MSMHSAIVRCASAAVILAAAGMACGAPISNADDTTLDFANSLSGSFKLERAASLARGEGASFDNVTITVPLVLDFGDAFLNSAMAEVIDGENAGAATLWVSYSGDGDGFHQIGPGSADARSAVVSLSDSCSGNNLILDESLPGLETTFATLPFGPFPQSTNSPGVLLPSGELSIRAAFNSFTNGDFGFTQNNIEFTNINNQLPGDAVTPSGSFDKIFERNPDIDSGPVGFGSVFVSSPYLFNVNATDTLLGQSNFAFSGSLVNIGINVWEFDRTGNFTNSGDTPGPAQITTQSDIATWSQDDFIVPSVCELGEVEDARRYSTPVIWQFDVQCPNGSNNEIYIAWGAGLSSGSFDDPPGGEACDGLGFGGGSATPYWIIADNVPMGGSGVNGFADGVIYHTANGAGPADVNPDIRFLDHQGTGGGTANTTHMFDINSAGQMVVVVEDFTDADPLNDWSVVLYNPVFDGDCNFTGWDGGTVIATSNELLDNGTRITTIEDTFASDGEVLDSFDTPFGGVSISEDGLVAFVATVEAFLIDVEIPSGKGTVTVQDVGNTTEALFVYDIDTDTLHEVVRGGQNGDTIPVRDDCAGGDGVPVVESITLGWVPTFLNSDQFSAQGLSETGGVVAFTFRNGGNEGGVDLDEDMFDDDGGVLNFAGGGEQSVRGVALVSLGDLTVGPISNCIGDINGDGNTDALDLNAVLGNFGCTAPDDCTSGDINDDGNTDALDLNQVLGDFGCVTE